jgi:hypothetical protein
VEQGIKSRLRKRIKRKEGRKDEKGRNKNYCEICFITFCVYLIALELLNVYKAIATF